jgi:hypothetical protein
MANPWNLLIGLACVLVAAGCKSSTAAASGGADGAASASGGAFSAKSAGTRVENITDPSLNMTAVSVTVPANWHFDGTLMQGGGRCVSVPFPVFRVTSPDGLSAFEREPSLGWTWGSGPMAGTPAKDCLPLRAAMGAQDFLKYLAGTMGLKYVSDVPEPEAENQVAQQGLQHAEAVYAPKYAASRLTPPKATRELARARVSFQNGTFAMLGELRVTVDCMQTTFPGMKSILRGIPDRPDSVVNQCTASTRYYTAPAAQLPKVLALWDEPGMGAVGSQSWQQAWVDRNQRQADQAEARNMAASRAKFQQDMAVQAQMHQQFLATMQRGTDMSMARTQQSMDARSTATSDWVDYALDQRTVMDPSTGQVSKVSSAYSYTWVDSTGKTSYQTNDPNANPNGVLQGSWTKQQVVHGDGTP